MSTETKSVTYKGRRKAAKGTRKMVRDGWFVAAHTTHRKWWSMWTGLLLFRRKRNVVTYTRYEPSAEEGAELECLPGCVFAPGHAGLCNVSDLPDVKVTVTADTSNLRAGLDAIRKRL